MEKNSSSDSVRRATAELILGLLTEGVSTVDMLARHPELTEANVRAAAALGLAALRSPRPETRDERIARLRRTHPRAYEPWQEAEDARLLRRYDEGARVKDLAREFERPENAIRARLEKWLGPAWRNRSLVGDAYSE